MKVSWSLRRDGKSFCWKSRLPLLLLVTVFELAGPLVKLGTGMPATAAGCWLLLLLEQLLLYNHLCAPRPNLGIYLDTAHWVRMRHNVSYLKWETRMLSLEPLVKISPNPRLRMIGHKACLVQVHWTDTIFTKDSPLSQDATQCLLSPRLCRIEHTFCLSLSWAAGADTYIYQTTHWVAIRHKVIYLMWGNRARTFR